MRDGCVLKYWVKLTLNTYQSVGGAAGPGQVGLCSAWSDWADESSHPLASNKPRHRPPVPPQPVRLTDFNTPGADLPGVHYLRNVQDADSLIAAIAAVKQGGSHNAKVRRPPGGERAAAAAPRSGRAGGRGRRERRCCCGGGRAVRFLPAPRPAAPHLAWLFRVLGSRA